MRPLLLLLRSYLHTNFHLSVSHSSILTQALMLALTPATAPCALSRRGIDHEVVCRLSRYSQGVTPLLIEHQALSFGATHFQKWLPSGTSPRSFGAPGLASASSSALVELLLIFSRPACSGLVCDRLPSTRTAPGREFCACECGAAAVITCLHICRALRSSSMAVSGV